MSDFINIRFRRFGRAVVEVLTDKRDSQRERLWECLCDCGTIFYANSRSLRRGMTQSCGCLGRERFTSRKHGKCYTPEYRSWLSMVQRCHLSKQPLHIKYYQERGITVCDRWRHSVLNFIADMGPRPKGKTLDRINNNGNYEPGNCKWSTPKEQCKNRTRIGCIPWKKMYQELLANRNSEPIYGVDNAC